ncbi:MAG TPA: o-succinylbenzoate synthase, partial [Candidatus Omnitrophota bacterium]|nr:o-succinylbenzoate synthase [Candidatus Omnitrophota bacterium]
MIQTAEIFRYAIPLQLPMMLDGRLLKEREGFFIKITDKAGAVGWGEAASFQDGLTETEVQMINAAALLRDQPLPEAMAEMNAIHINGVALSEYKPTVQWAVETALFTLKANRQGLPLARMINRRSELHVPVTCFLAGTLAEIVSQAEAALRQGYRTFQIKVGQGGALQDDIERVRAVNAVIESKALLRVDANRSWELPEAIEFIRQVGLTTIEYIEEPLKDFSRVGEFYQETLMPVALDESIRTLDIDRIQSLEGVDVLLLKPALLGGFHETWQLATGAQDRGLRVVFGSVFESGYGLTVIAHMAACLARNIPVNLDTGKFFTQDVLTAALTFPHASMS